MQTTHGSGRTVVAKVVDDAIAGRRCSGCITSGRTENGVSRQIERLVTIRGRVTRPIFV